VDEFYSANMGQDIKRGMRENASRGFFNGSRPAYGFHVVKVQDGPKIRNKLEPLSEDSIEVTTICRAFDMALMDSGCKQIARALNKDGLVTGTGKKWGRVPIHRLLTNEAYCGNSVWGLNKGHSAIIQPDVFNVVQRKLASRSPKNSHPRTVSSEYKLSNKILFCSCGATMMGHSAKSGKYQYYICSRKYREGKESCNAQDRPRNTLEEAVINQIKLRILTYDNLAELVRLVNDELKDYSGELQKKLQALEKEANNINQRISRLYDALEVGEGELKLELKNIAPRLKELQNRQGEISNAKGQLEADKVIQKVNEVDLDTIKTYANEFREILESASFVEQKAFLKSFIKRVVVDEDKVTIRYKLPKIGAENAEEESVLPIVSLGGAEGIRTITENQLEFLVLPIVQPRPPYWIESSS
jgi:site-specific DNA recombinase